MTPNPAPVYVATCPCGAGITARSLARWTFLRANPHVAMMDGFTPPGDVPTCRRCHLASPSALQGRPALLAARIESRAAIRARWPHVRDVIDRAKTWRDWLEADAADPDGAHLEEAERALAVSVDLLARYDADCIARRNHADA